MGRQYKAAAFSLFSSIAALVCAPLAAADVPRFVDYELDSGWVENTGESRAVIFSDVVDVAEASWLRVDFEEAVLGPAPEGGHDTIVRLTSFKDGASQRLNAVHVVQWQHMSAYFNGGSVRVEIESDPGAAPSRIKVNRVLAGPLWEMPESICDGVDERQLSEDKRVGRGLTSGGSANCSAWLVNDCQKCLVAAGHCGFSQVHFNVPLSSSTGAPQMSHPDDQYAVDPASRHSQNSGVGQDWLYFGCFPNPNTGLTPFEAQGAAFTLVDPPPVVPANQPIRITGFGSTSSPVPPQWNRAQKTHTGPYISFSGSTLSYRPDTTSGNSGSPVIYELTGQAIGVHTHGGCTSSGGANRGTASTNPSWRNAMLNPTGVCAPVDCTPGCPQDWNGDGVVDSDDLLDFLDDWAAGDADFNADGVTDSSDLFDFLAAWAEGC